MEVRLYIDRPIGDCDKGSNAHAVSRISALRYEYRLLGDDDVSRDSPSDT